VYRKNTGGYTQNDCLIFSRVTKTHQILALPVTFFEFEWQISVSGFGNLFFLLIRIFKRPRISLFWRQLTNLGYPRLQLRHFSDTQNGLRKCSSHSGWKMQQESVKLQGFRLHLADLFLPKGIDILHLLQSLQKTGGKLRWKCYIRKTALWLMRSCPRTSYCVRFVVTSWMTMIKIKKKRESSPASTTFAPSRKSLLLIKLSFATIFKQSWFVISKSLRC